MQLFVNCVAGKTVVVEVDPSDCVGRIAFQIEEQMGIPMEEQRLSHNGRQLDIDDAESTLTELGLHPCASLELNGRLCGGGSYDRTDPKLVQLAKSYRWDQLICRKCYARAHSKATNCRKCGSSDLRKRKVMLSKPL